MLPLRGMSPWHTPALGSSGRCAVALLAALLFAACGETPPNETSPGENTLDHGEESDGLSPDAQVDTFEMMREDLLQPRHPSDGGGIARLLSPGSGESRPELRAGSVHPFVIEYEAGPLGIADGGALYLQPSPFWGWDPPQTHFPEGPGYTQFSSEAEGIELARLNVGPDLAAVTITGRALEPGERIRIAYGSPAGGARVDRYAENESRIWLAVDGDGDGIRKVIAEPPSVRILPGPAARLVIHGPSTAGPGDAVAFDLALVDALGSGGVPFEGEILLRGSRPGLELPHRVRLEIADGGHKQILATVSEPGVYRVRAATADSPVALIAETNPLVVREGVANQLWGDLHGHSNLSDGTGTPADYFGYARSIAGLDFAALTDHDHWGMRFLDSHPEIWAEIERATEEANDPERFVSILGFEWTSWLHGHRHVLYFADEGPLLSSMDPEIQNPAELWDALRGQPALTFAHHSAGGPVATNWNYPPDPEFEPVTEIVSVHGSSEAADSPGLIYKPVFGNFVRETLADRGYVLGFVGSGDSHDGHPGLSQLSSTSEEGGLTAVLAEHNTRADIEAALKARRVYATNGARIFLRVTLDGEPMGSVFRPVPGAPPTQKLEVRVAAVGPLRKVEIIRGRDVVESIALEGEREWSLSRDVDRLAAGDHLYVRVIQEDGGVAWSSPIFAR